MSWRPLFLLLLLFSLPCLAGKAKLICVGTTLWNGIPLEAPLVNVATTATFTHTSTVASTSQGKLYEVFDAARRVGASNRLETYLIPIDTKLPAGRDTRLSIFAYPTGKPVPESYVMTVRGNRAYLLPPSRIPHPITFTNPDIRALSISMTSLNKTKDREASGRLYIGTSHGIYLSDFPDSGEETHELSSPEMVYPEGRADYIFALDGHDFVWAEEGGMLDTDPHFRILRWVKRKPIELHKGKGWLTSLSGHYSSKGLNVWFTVVDADSNAKISLWKDGVVSELPFEVSTPVRTVYGANLPEQVYLPTQIAASIYPQNNKVQWTDHVIDGAFRGEPLPGERLPLRLLALSRGLLFGKVNGEWQLGDPYIIDSDAKKKAKQLVEARFKWRMFPNQAFAEQKMKQRLEATDVAPGRHKGLIQAYFVRQRFLDYLEEEHAGLDAYLQSYRLPDRPSQVLFLLLFSAPLRDQILSMTLSDELRGRVSSLSARVNIRIPRILTVFANEPSKFTEILDTLSPLLFLTREAIAEGLMPFLQHPERQGQTLLHVLLDYMSVMDPLWAEQFPPAPSAQDSSELPQEDSE